MYKALLLYLSTLVSVGFCDEPNPPSWPSSVLINPSQSDVDAAYQENGGENFNGQFSSSRYAFLYEPGNYDVNIGVGYYTSVYGTGISPEDTKLTSVWVPNTGGSALCNFWRSAENFATTQNDGNAFMWAVSQASPLRRVIFSGDLNIFEGSGYSSGGYLGDVTVTGKINAGTQQQWFSRNTHMGSWNSGGNWNFVFVGCDNAPATQCGQTTPIVINEAKTPLIAEKPYIHIDNGQYYLMIPPVEWDKSGNTQDYNAAKKVDFKKVYVATDSDSASTINAKLDTGLHVIFSPGNYYLDDAIRVTNNDTVLLGIGFPTLEPTNGKPVVEVANGLQGVRLAGMLLQAGKVHSPSLLQFGDTAKDPGRSDNPGVLSDVYTRVGGPNNPNDYQVSVDSTMVINSNNVIIDGTWLWRADHDVSGNVVNSDNPAATGITVNGDNVIAYGLASEHFLGNMVVWNGENGVVYFYQSEFPYDVTQDNYADPGYVGYYVGANKHTAYGIGVYSYFRDHTVWPANGIATQKTSNTKFYNSFTFFLSGNGGILHVIDNKGGIADSDTRQQFVCEN